MSVAFLGLGGNLGDPIESLRLALSQLSATKGMDVTAVSSFYRTNPVGGPPNQPEYINAVVKVQCVLSPGEVLDRCLAIEQKLGRVRGERWGSRTIDIDVLLYDDQVIDLPNLVVPHPQLRKRLFVLVPLIEIVGADFELPPDGKKIRKVLEEADGDPAFDSQRTPEAVDFDVKRMLSKAENHANKKI